MTAFRLLLCALAIGVVAAAVFLAFPELDLMVSALFYQGDNQFVLTDNLAYRYFNDGIRPALKVAAVLILAWAIWRMVARPELRRDYARRIIYLALVFGIGPGLIVDAGLKSHSGRARPKKVVEFGGEYAYSPPFVVADQCSRNCSFVSGDASVAFAFVAFALMAQRRRGLWLAAALALGSVIGGLRVGLGAHFLSDTVFAGVISVSVAAACFWLFFERPLAARSPPPGAA